MENRVRDLEITIASMAELMNDLNNRVVILTQQVCGMIEKAPMTTDDPSSNAPTDEKIVELMESSGMGWEDCREKLMEEMKNDGS